MENVVNLNKNVIFLVNPLYSMLQCVQKIYILEKTVIFFV